MTTYWDIKKKIDQLVKSFKKTKVKHRKLHWQEQDEFIRRGSKDNNIVNKKRESYNGKKRVID